MPFYVVLMLQDMVGQQPFKPAIHSNPDPPLQCDCRTSSLCVWPVRAGQSPLLLLAVPMVYPNVASIPGCGCTINGLSFAPLGPSTVR